MSKYAVAASTAVLLILAVIPPGVRAAQQPPQPQPVTVQKVAGNVYMVKGGSGANTGFYAGDQEVLVIDAKMTPDSARQMIEEIAKLTPKPITRVVLTHSDGDHVNGLGGFPKGLKIYAHARTRSDMEEAFKQPNLQALQDYLPNAMKCPEATGPATCGMLIPLSTGAVRQIAQLYYYGPAHTSGDVTVFFPDEKVAFVGDLVFIGRDPLIHRQKGGTSLGLVENLKSLLALDANQYVPGHGEIATKADIEKLKQGVEEKQTKIREMIQAGKTLDEIKKAFGVEDRPPQPGGRRWMSLVEVIYLDLTEKK